MSTTSSSDLTSQNYILFSRSFGNILFIKEKKMSIFVVLVEYLKSEIPCTALLHTESLKEKKRGRKKCLFNLNGE